jgi:phosphate uptake regulator
MSMETRKVQRTGKSTYIVSLPKSWASKNHIESGSIIYIFQSDNGALMLLTNRCEKDLSIRLEIGDKEGEPLIRDIVACYVAGYKTVEITSRRISAAQKRDLHQIVNKLIGPEILEETISKVVIQDLLSSEELEVEKALRRMKTVVKSMMQDAISSLIGCNRELAADVVRRDNDVDRLNLLVSRQFTEILRSGSVRREALNAITNFNYMQAASNLERVADHALKIARIVDSTGCKLPEGISIEISRLEPIFCGLIDDSVQALLHGDSKKANELIDKTREVQRCSQMMANTSRVKDKDEMLVRLVVAGSLERMLDYIMNIGELTINLRNASIDIA